MTNSTEIFELKRRLININNELVSVIHDSTQLAIAAHETGEGVPGLVVNISLVYLLQSLTIDKFSIEGMIDRLGVLQEQLQKAEEESK